MKGLIIIGRLRKSLLDNARARISLKAGKGDFYLYVYLYVYLYLYYCLSVPLRRKNVPTE